MTALLDIDDVCSGHPMAMAELAALRQIATQANTRPKILRQATGEMECRRLYQDFREEELWLDNIGLALYLTSSRIDT